MSRTATSAFVLTLAVGGVVAATAFVGPPDDVAGENPEQLEPVVRSTSVCPYLGGEPRASFRLGVLALPGIDEPEWTPAEEGEEPPPITVQRLAGPDSEPDAFLTVEERGVPSSRAVERENPAGYAIGAEGPLAPGVAAAQYLRVSEPDLHGLSTSTCTAAAREHWFAGASGQEGRRGRLVLSNPSPATAVVNVALFDEIGPVEDAPGMQDVTIPARSQEVLVLDALAPEAEDLGVYVRATQGRVAAALDYREFEEGEPGGVTTIPAAAEPATEVVVPGVPSHGERTLSIFVPGETDALVSVRVLGVGGPFSPVDHDAVTVSAGSVLTVPLSDALGDEPAAIALESDEPVTAAVRVVSASSDGMPDLAYTAATQPLTADPAGALFGRDDDGVSSRLLLTAVGDMGGRATVQMLDPDGRVDDEQTLDIPALTTVEVDLEAPEDTSWVTAVVRAASPGTVVGTREIYGETSAGDLIDVLPLRAPDASVQVPTVVSELPTGLVPPEPGE